MTITAATRLFALLGDPVSHSQSPPMQNAAFLAANIDAVYVALRCNADDVIPLLRALAHAGGGGNVTVPHKARAALGLDACTPAVTATNACNTFWQERGQVIGDNTDVAGFLAAAEALVGSLHGVQALVLGAGGAASAVVYALRQAGAERIAVHNRTPERAAALVTRQASPAVRLASSADRTAGSWDLIVNATSLGMHGRDACPLDLGSVGRAGAVLDLVYGARVTPLIVDAAKRGIPCADGREMLVHQGGVAFERWFGRTAPVEVMRAALAAPPG